MDPPDQPGLVLLLGKKVFKKQTVELSRKNALHGTKTKKKSRSTVSTFPAVKTGRAMAWDVASPCPEPEPETQAQALRVQIFVTVHLKCSFFPQTLLI